MHSIKNFKNRPKFASLILDDQVPFYVFGANVYTESLIEHFDVLGVIDDFSNKETFKGVPIFRSTQVKDDELIVIASGGNTLSVAEFLENKKLNWIDYFYLKNNTTLPLAEVVFNENFKELYQNRLKEFEYLREKLHDDESKCVFDKIINFRSSLNIEHLLGLKENQINQYFEEFIPKIHDHVFYDVGCFDGETSVAFARRFEKYDFIYGFEPLEENIKLCLKKFDALKKASLLKFGLSSTDRTVKFSSDGSTSRINIEGKEIVTLKRGDDLQIAPPTFIKIDVEGAEVDVLMGLENRIRAHAPTLAICVYHKPMDIIDVSEVISNFGVEYNIFLRHYTETIYETVMFFVPKKLNS